MTDRATGTESTARGTAEAIETLDRIRLAKVPRELAGTVNILVEKFVAGDPITTQDLLPPDSGFIAGKRTGDMVAANKILELNRIFAGTGVRLDYIENPDRADASPAQYLAFKRSPIINPGQAQ